MSETILAFCYIILFLGSIVVTTIVFKDIDLTKIFKVYKVGSIRALYIIIIIVSSTIISLGITKLFESFYKMLLGF